MMVAHILTYSRCSSSTAMVRMPSHLETIDLSAQNKDEGSKNR